MPNSATSFEKCLTPIGKKSDDIIKSVKNYIKKNDCKHMTVDISSSNILDASKISVLCSTYHYLKYPKGLISWIVKSKSVEQMVKHLDLGNINFQTAKKT